MATQLRPVTNSPSPIPPSRTRSHNEQCLEMEIDRRFFARFSGWRRHRGIRERGHGPSLLIRSAPSWLRRPGDEEPFTMATSIDGRADGQNLADHRKNGHAARRNPGRHRPPRARGDCSSAPGYRAHPYAGTERAFAANGTTVTAVDASRDRKSTRLNSSHSQTPQAYSCLIKQ